MTRSSLLRPTHPRAAVFACAALMMASAASRPAQAQKVPDDDDEPARTAPADAPRAPAPAPSAAAPASEPPPDAVPGGKLRIPDDAPPLPRGTLPSSIYYDSPRYKLRYQERRLTGLMGAGIGVFGGAYLLSVGFGAYANDQKLFLIPVIGPIIYTSRDKLVQAGLVFDTIIQASGAIMLITGAVLKVKVPVRDPVAVVPVVVPGGGAGLAAVGTW